MYPTEQRHVATSDFSHSSGETRHEIDSHEESGLYYPLGDREGEGRVE